MAENDNRYGSNRNQWRKIYGYGRRKPNTVQVYDRDPATGEIPTSGTLRSFDANTTLRHRDFFKIQGITSASYLQLSSAVNFFYEEGDVIFRNVSEVTGTAFASSFGGPPIVTYQLLPRLVENSSSNILTASRDFDNAIWDDNNIGEIQENVAGNPITGEKTATKIAEETEPSNAVHFLTQEDIQVDGSSQYCFSVYLKAAERTWAQLSLSNAGFGSAGFAFFNLATGVKGSGVNVDDFDIIDIGEGWYRCWLTNTSNSSTATWARISLATGNGDTSYPGVEGYGFYIFQAQFEIAASPSETLTAASVDNINVFGLSIPTNTSLDVGVSAPYSGSVKYRAFWSAAGPGIFPWYGSNTFTSSITMSGDTTFLSNQNDYTGSYVALPTGAGTETFMFVDTIHHNTIGVTGPNQANTARENDSYSNTSSLNSLTAYTNLAQVHYMAFNRPT
jgi:hypothetical protein